MSKRLFVFLAAACAIAGIVSPPVSADETKSERVVCGQDFVSVIRIPDSGAKWAALRKTDIISVETLPDQHVAAISVNRSSPSEKHLMTVWVAIEDFWAVVGCLD